MGRGSSQSSHADDVELWLDGVLQVIFSHHSFSTESLLKTASPLVSVSINELLSTDQLLFNDCQLSDRHWVTFLHSF